MKTNPSHIQNKVANRKAKMFLYTLFCLVFSLATLRLLSISGESLLAVPSISQVGTAVGVTVSVESNQYNALADQLQHKSDTLAERERTVQESERKITIGAQTADATLQYLLGISGFLAILILLNFFFDWRRTKDMKYVSV